MAQIRMMYWKDIPYGVRAKDDGGQITRQLPGHFQEAVDAAAMVDGDTDQDRYQSGFRWDPPVERPGSAAEAADAMVAEIVAAYPEERLGRLASRKGSPD